MAKLISSNLMSYLGYDKGEEAEATKDWKEYDYQKDIETDPALQPVKQVGREVID